MHNDKYQSHTAASCTYHLPTIISLAAQQEPYKKA